MLIFPTYQTLLTKPAADSGFAGVTDNLEVHYDFSDTNCWSRGTGTDTADYTVYNLANSYGNALIRSATGTSTSFRDGSDSPVIGYNSTDGGGCFETDMSNFDGNEDDCAIIIPGAFSSSNVNHDTYNITTVSATSSENLLKDVGTGSYTAETWIRVYGDTNGGNGSAPHNVLYGRVAGEDDDTLIGSWTQYLNSGQANSSYRDRLVFVYWAGSYHTYHSTHILTNVPGTPASGGGWSDWLHVVLVRDTGSGSDNIKIYVNNTLEESYTQNWSIECLQYARLLRVWSSASEDQRLGIFRLYKNKALSASEVTTNWNLEKARFGH